MSTLLRTKKIYKCSKTRFVCANARTQNIFLGLGVILKECLKTQGEQTLKTTTKKNASTLDSMAEGADLDSVWSALERNFIISKARLMLIESAH